MLAGWGPWAWDMGSHANMFTWQLIKCSATPLIQWTVSLLVLQEPMDMWGSGFFLDQTKVLVEIHSGANSPKKFPQEVG